jgi:hypothetical protein
MATRGIKSIWYFRGRVYLDVSVVPASGFMPETENRVNRELVVV